MLKQLDKFDDWNPRQVQTIFERMICAIAGLGKSIAGGQPRSGYTPLVKAFREVGSDATRGEPWDQARKLLDALGIDVPALAEVQHDFTMEELEDAIAPPSPTRFTRMTRSRRAVQENREVKRINLREASVSDSDDGAGADDPADEDKAAYVDSSDEEEQPAEAPVPERSNGRENLRRTNRTRRLMDSDEDEANSRAPSAAGDASGANEQSRELSPVSVLSEESVALTPPTAAAKAKTPEPAAPLPAPHFEEKVAILTALVEVLLQTPAVNQELRRSVDEIHTTERDSRANAAAHEKELNELIEAHNKSAPSFATQKEAFEEWKKKRDKLERDRTWAMLEHRVALGTTMQRLKLRTGPLGVDVDGREYWQLTECEEGCVR